MTGRTMFHQRPTARSGPESGQMLIEALFGLALVSTILVVLVSLSLRSLRVQLLNKQWQQTDALEQESLEVIRQIRDGYGLIRFYDTGTSTTVEGPWDWIDTDIWKASGTSYFRLYYDTAQTRWIMDQTTATSPTDTVYRLYWDSASRTYGHPGSGGFPAGATASPFYRQVVFTETAESPQSRAVSCVLTWYDRGTQHQSKVVSLFSQW